MGSAPTGRSPRRRTIKARERGRPDPALLATFALRAGISIFDLSRYMGASLAMIDRHYGHLARDGRKNAVALLDALAADPAWTPGGRRNGQPKPRRSNARKPRAPVLKARGQVFFVPPARLPVIAHIGHGYSLREIATHLGFSVTTVPPTRPRQWRRATEFVGTGRGWNEEDLTPALQRFSPLTHASCG